MRYLKHQLFQIDATNGDLYYAEIAGTSLESKPTTGIIAGSAFVETDTGKRYVFDEDNITWTEVVSATAEVSSE